MLRNAINLLLCLTVAMSCLADLALGDKGRDFYKILELKRSATPAEIKKSYRRLTLQYHPDKNPDDKEALEKFHDVAAAYEALSDPELRRKYDRCGEECVNQPEQQGSPFDIFGGLFGGGRASEQTGPGIQLKIKVTLEELYLGQEFEVTYNRKVICPHCRGSGADDPDHVKECSKCQGKGQILTKKQLAPGFVQQFQQQCPKCSGTGQLVTSTCHVCKGDKLTGSLDSLMIWVEKGTADGHILEYRDQADEYINVRPGAVNVKVQQLEHPVFERKDNDLKVRVHISLKEALLGFEKTLVHLDGAKVRFNRLGKVTKPGLMERFKGKGMPLFESYSGDHGDLLVTYIVDMPTELSDGQRELFQEFFQ